MQSGFKQWIIRNKLDFLYKCKYDLFSIDLYNETSIRNNSLIGSEDTDYVVFSEKGDTTAYYPVKDSDRLKLFDKKALKKIIDKYKDTKEKYELFCDKYFEVDKKKIDIIKFFDDFCSIYTDLVACFRTTRPVYVDPLVDDLRKMLLKTKASLGYLSPLMISNKTDDIRLEQCDWILLLKDKKLESIDLEKHITKYPWLFPSTYSLDKAIKQLEKRYYIDHSNIKDKLKDYSIMQRELLSNLNKKFKYLQKCSRDISKLSNIVTDLSDYRTYFKLKISGIKFIFRDFFIEISSLAKLDPEIFYNSYTISDIKRLIKNKKSLPISLVKQRNKYYCYIVKNLKSEINYDLKYKSILKKYFLPNREVQITGAVACSGNVVGVAVVSSSNELKKIKESSLIGNILVTTMTDPSIMPFIRNCIGIVTDEGGLTSHAGIVSRELNIPCIVGTKIGTQVIKTGDKIELDAINGIIRIID